MIARSFLAIVMEQRIEILESRFESFRKMYIPLLSGLRSRVREMELSILHLRNRDSSRDPTVASEPGDNDSNAIRCSTPVDDFVPMEHVEAELADIEEELNSFRDASTAQRSSRSSTASIVGKRTSNVRKSESLSLARQRSMAVRNGFVGSKICYICKQSFCRPHSVRRHLQDVHNVKFATHLR